MELINDHIVISDNGIEYLANLVNSRDFEGVFVLADENTSKHCVPLLEGFEFEVITVQSGEVHKTLATCEKIFDELVARGANRKSLLINVGGGVLGDIGGFCAAIFLRGIYFVNVPTSLLAMVDASVGGKLGVDFKGLKNYIGLFKEPLGVFIHPPFLKTLPERELKAGFAEMMKHALVHDAIHWGELQDFDPRRLKMWITTSVAIKDEIVEMDMHENGERKLLNFGHTIGHAIESWFLEHGRQPILHGEAVALGMLCEAYLSQKTGLSNVELDSIINGIQKHFTLPKIATENMDAIIQLMHADKKNNRRGINFTLLKHIGHGIIDNYCSEEEIKETLVWYNSL